MKLGIGTYCYMWSIGFQGTEPADPLTARGLLDKARELGVSVVQMGPNLPLVALPEEELERFVGQARTWRIDLELATRGLETNHLRRQLVLAKQLGSPLLRTIPEVDGRAVGAEETLHRVREILPVFEGEGVVLALENGKIPAEELRWVIEQAASPYLGIVLDTVNSLAVPEGWRHVAKTLAPYTVCLHIKEFVVDRIWSMMGFTVEGRPAGAGQLDIPWLVETVVDAGGRGNAILELWPPEQKTLQETIDLEQAWVIESVRYLRTIIPL
jgi:sugar phosphate isomerase/epimerase